MPQPGGGRFAVPGKELDAKGAATDGRHVYVTGSHAVKRSDCKPNPGSRYVLRFLRGPATGLAQAAADGSTLPAGYQQMTRLLALIAADFQLQDSLGAGRCLGTGALDIEALAVRDGRLHVGLRVPTEAGWAILLWNDRQAPGQAATTRLLATPDQAKVVRSACDKETKLEALTVLEESARSYRVLVLSDGGPLVFDILQ